jgi:hypothetical protein
VLDLSFVRAWGRVALVLCRFTDRPDFEQAELAALNLKGSHLPGLAAPGMQVGRSVMFDGVTATGTVDVVSAKIGGQLSCAGAMLDGKAGMALNAQGVETAHDLFLRGVTARGTVSVNGATVGGQLDCEGAKFLSTKFIKEQGSNTDSGETPPEFKDWEWNALHAQGMQAAMLFWREVTVGGGAVTLTAARVGDLADDGAWPTGANELDLEGFVYDRIIGNAAPKSAEGRRDWLEAGSLWEGKFRPQPYTQLARVLREMGHDGEARTVACWREKKLLDQRQREILGAPRSGTDVAYGGIWRGIRAWLIGVGRRARARLIWVWSFVLRSVAGYGFKPWRAGIALVVLWAIAWGLSAAVWHKGSFAPNSDVILTSAGWQAALAADCFPPKDDKAACIGNPAREWSAEGAIGMDWDSFSSWGYALDLVVPVLDLGQTSAWAPSKDRGWAGWVLWWGRWVLQGMGWFVLLIFAAAVTGIMQRNRD